MNKNYKIYIDENKCKEYLDALIGTKTLAEHDKQIRADVIEEIKQSIHEIHKYQLYCMEEYCEYEEPTSHDCIECLYIAMQSCLERLKEQK